MIYHIYQKNMFYVYFSLKYESISHLRCNFSAFNRFCWVQMLACLEECLEWCLLLLGSCDDVYIVTSMSCRRRRGKREGAGTGEWCEMMLWLVNIKKSLPCIVCVYSGDLDDFLWTSLSLCLSHKTFCIDCRPSSDLLLFYYSCLIKFISKRDYCRFWGIFRLCCRCILFLKECLRCNVGHWNAGSTLTCRESVTGFKRSVVFMRAHKANIDCEIFSVYKLWLFLVLDSEMLKPLEVVLYQRCLLQVELISCKASAMLFLRQKPYSMQNHCEIFKKECFKTLYFQ